MTASIHIHDEGERVRAHQQHLDDRLRAHGSGQVTVEGDCGPETIAESALAAWFLGALYVTVEKVEGGDIPGGVIAMIADPRGRSQAQLKRARERRNQTFAPTPSRP